MFFIFLLSVTRFLSMCFPHQYQVKLSISNPWYNGNPLTSTYANSADPDEMPHPVAFHQGLHCLQKYIWASTQENLSTTKAQTDQRL